MYCMSNEMLKQILGFDPIKDACTRLEKSRARGIQVREVMQSLRKDFSIILEYMLSGEMIANDLEIACCGIIDEQNLTTALDDLDKNYDNVFSTLKK